MSELQDADKALDFMQSQADAAQAELDSLRAQLETARQEIERWKSAFVSGGGL